MWGLVKPESWIVIGLAIAVLALFRRRLRLARAAGALTLAATVAIAVLPLGEVLLRPLETRYPVNPPLDRVDGIVVLGGAEQAGRTALWDQPQFNEAAERMTAALALARRFPDARLVYSGGSGALRDVADADALGGTTVAARFFDDQGLDPDRLVLESRSRNTAENAALSLPLADPSPDETWLLVTSAFHMPRAVSSFRRAGWPDLVAYPVDFRTGPIADGFGWDLAENLTLLNTAAKEYVGLVVYSLTGR